MSAAITAFEPIQTRRASHSFRSLPATYRTRKLESKRDELIQQLAEEYAEVYRVDMGDALAAVLFDVLQSFGGDSSIPAADHYLDVMAGLGA